MRTGWSVGAVDQQVPDSYAVGHRQLHVRREGRAAHAHDTGHLHGFDECFERQGSPVGRRVGIDFLRREGVGFDRDRRRETAIDTSKVADLANDALDRAV
jgi:hypothetical protein